MTVRYIRSMFMHTNKYQRRIIALTFIPSLILCILLTLFIFYFHRELINMILYSSTPPSIQFIRKWGIITLITLWAFFISVIIWAFRVSNNLVGAFERILRELDEMIAGREYKRLRARSDDDLANELLKRINALLQNPPGSK